MTEQLDDHGNPLGTKYDSALSNKTGYIIVVSCSTCDRDYDVREVTDQVQHPVALHVMSFTCPQGHKSEVRRLWVEAGGR